MLSAWDLPQVGFAGPCINMEEALAAIRSQVRAQEGHNFDIATSGIYSVLCSINITTFDS